MSLITLADLRNDLQSAIYETNIYRTFSAAELNRWINIGYHDFIQYVRPLMKEWAYPIVTVGKPTFYVPNDCLGISRLNWTEQWPIIRCDEKEFRQRIWTAPAAQSQYPSIYKELKGAPGPNQSAGTPGSNQTAVNPGTGPGWVIEIWQPPSIASVTVQTTGTVPATTATATITSSTTIPTGGFGWTASSFGSRGYFWLGTPNTAQGELIRYFNISADKTQFLACDRGIGNTVIQSWPPGTTVTYAPLQMFYEYDPPDLVNDTDIVQFSENAWHEALVQYAAYRCFSKKQNMPQQAAGAMQNYSRIREEAKFISMRGGQLDRPAQILPYEPGEAMGNWRL